MVAKINEALAAEAGGLYAQKAHVKDALALLKPILEGLATDPDAIDPFLNKERAKKIISDANRSMDLANYLFVLDMNHTVVSHPIQRVVGQDWSKETDPSGKKNVRRDGQSGQGEGRRLCKPICGRQAARIIRPFLAYVRMLDQWDWVIGSAVFLNQKQ